MKKFCLSCLFFLILLSFPAQEIKLKDIRQFHSFSPDELEEELLKEWKITKTGEVKDIPAKGIRNIQFQAGNIRGRYFINLEKISYDEDNLLMSIFVKDEGEIYNKVKERLVREGYKNVEMENFLAPFQNLISTDYFLKETELFQLDIYEDAEGVSYYLILFTTPEQYRQYQKFYKLWKKKQ